MMVKKKGMMVKKGKMGIRVDGNERTR